MDLTSTVGLVVGGVSILGAVFAYSIQLVIRKKADESLDKQLKELDNISKSLQNLIDFIDEQQERLRENQKTLSRIKLEKDELQPLLHTERGTVDAILNYHAMRQKKSRIWDHAVAFFLGILTSTIVSYVFILFEQ